MKYGKTITIAAVVLFLATFATACLADDQYSWQNPAYNGGFYLNGANGSVGTNMTGSFSYNTSIWTPATYNNLSSFGGFEGYSFVEQNGNAGMSVNMSGFNSGGNYPGFQSSTSNAFVMTQSNVTNGWANMNAGMSNNAMVNRFSGNTQQ